MGKEIWKAGNMLYPLPVVMASVADADGNTNIITLAWVGTVCTNPPMVSISVRPERYSYNILKETGEFVINLTTEALVRATDYCGVKSGREVDKFKQLGLTPVPAQYVKAPLIGESPVNIECRVKQVLSLGSHDMFIAEVLAVHADEAYKDERGKFCLEKANPVVYSHGEYLTCGEKVGTFGFSVRKNKADNKTNNKASSKANNKTNNKVNNKVDNKADRPQVK